MSWTQKHYDDYESLARGVIPPGWSGNDIQTQRIIDTLKFLSPDALHIFLEMCAYCDWNEYGVANACYSALPVAIENIMSGKGFWGKVRAFFKWVPRRPLRIALTTDPEQLRDIANMLEKTGRPNIGQKRMVAMAGVRLSNGTIVEFKWPVGEEEVPA